MSPLLDGSGSQGWHSLTLMGLRVPTAAGDHGLGPARAVPSRRPLIATSGRIITCITPMSGRPLIGIMCVVSSGTAPCVYLGGMTARSSADPIDSLPVMGAVGATDSGPCMHTGVAPLRANNLLTETRIGSGSTASSGPQPSTAAVLLVRGVRRGGLLAADQASSRWRPKRPPSPCQPAPPRVTGEATS